MEIELGHEGDDEKDRRDEESRSRTRRWPATTMRPMQGEEG